MTGGCRAAELGNPARRAERTRGRGLALITEGLSNAEIAARLFVGESTVKTHINRISTQTRGRNRSQASAYAHRHGLAS